MKISSRHSFYEAENTLDLINGIHLTFTFQNPDASPGDIHEVLPEVVDNFYDSLDSKVAYQPFITYQPPTLSDLENTQDNKGLLLVLVIAPNSKTIRHHLHVYAYFLHQYNTPLNKFHGTFDRKMRRCQLISSTGRPIYYTSVTDPVDARIRTEGSLAPLQEYITARKPPSLIHYLHNKNNKDFAYHYVPSSKNAKDQHLV